MSIAAIIALGVGAQWLAWGLRLPSILILLTLGFIVGPATGWLQPDSLFGDQLFPLVSLAVAIILFEGGLSLTYAELRRFGGVVRNLVTLGALVTWAMSAAFAALILRLDWGIAALFGAILTVTGPTVIGPLLRYVRPVGPVGPILKWEGIVIDPVGATLAVLVLELVIAGDAQEAPRVMIFGILNTILVGGVIGMLGAGMIILLLRRYWVPDRLQNPIVLMILLVSFVLSDSLQHESGLLAVTVMGIIMANQPWVSIRHIIEFKENLQVLLIGGLFILLTARLELADFAAVGWESLIFLAAMVLLVRPASVWLSTIRSDLRWQERLFLSWMAPRGIVAAAVASLFGLRLANVGIADAERLAPLTFVVIAGTVLLYSLTTRSVAGWLGLASPNPNGVLFIGANPLARMVATAIQSQGVRVLLVDSNMLNILSARRAGLPAVQNNILAEDVLQKIDLGGIGQLFAMTPNDEVNTLAAMEFAHLFGRERVYQLAPQGSSEPNQESIPAHQRGRTLFGAGISYSTLSQHLTAGASVKALSSADLPASDERATLPLTLFLVDDGGKLLVSTEDRPLTPRAGQVVIALLKVAK